MSTFLMYHRQYGNNGAKLPYCRQTGHYSTNAFLGTNPLELAGVIHQHPKEVIGMETNWDGNNL
jgi:hypothetical protein